MKMKMMIMMMEITSSKVIGASAIAHRSPSKATPPTDPKPKPKPTSTPTPTTESPIIDKEIVCGIVIGLPLNMDGSEGPKCQSARDFAKNFSNIVDLPITFRDERLTTVAAERSLLSADLSRKKRRQVIDSVAAVLILQNLLDRLKNMDQRTHEH